MKLRIWGWFRRALGYPRLTIPYARGGWIAVDERDFLEGQIFATGHFEREVWEALSAFATGDEVVWDVGAHIGSFAITALLDRRVKEVHAFEPDPVSADILAFNLRLNRGRHYLHRLALGSQRETRTLYRGPVANTGLSTLVPDAAGGREAFPVECWPADDLIVEKGLSPPTLMKVDVEGWEPEVFLGAKRLLVAAPPKAIVFEAVRDASGGVAERQLVSELEGSGYDVRPIRRPGGVVDSRENFIAVRVAQ